MALLELPDPPYFVVIFSAKFSVEVEGYADISAALGQLVTEQKGYLGHRSVLDAQGREITVSYWKSEAAIQQWKQQEDHRQAQSLAKHGWFDYYQARISSRVQWEYRQQCWM